MRVSTDSGRFGHWYVLQLLSYLKILGGFYPLLIQGTGMHHVETSLPRNQNIRRQTSMFLFEDLFDHSGGMRDPRNPPAAGIFRASELFSSACASHGI